MSEQKKEQEQQEQQEKQEKQEQQEEAKEEAKEEKQEEAPASKETPSSKESEPSEIKELMNLVHLHGEQIKATHNLMESYRKEQEQTVMELRETVELLQQVISEKDAHLQKLMKSVHALTIVHDEMRQAPKEV